jgi:hypothetical protein
LPDPFSEAFRLTFAVSSSAEVRMTPPDRYDITFRLEPKDYKAFLSKVKRTGAEKAAGTLATLGAITVGGLLGLWLWYSVDGFFPRIKPETGTWLCVVAGCIAGLLWSVFYARKAALLAAFSGQPIGMAETRIVADAIGIHASSASVATGTPWRRLALTETKTHFFLMFGRATGHIVPRRAFRTKDEAEAFGAFLRARLAPGAGAPPAPSAEEAPRHGA